MSAVSNFSLKNTCKQIKLLHNQLQAISFMKTYDQDKNVKVEMGKTGIRAVNHNSSNCLTHFSSSPRNGSFFFQMT